MYDMLIFNKAGIKTNPCVKHKKTPSFSISFQFISFYRFQQFIYDFITLSLMHRFTFLLLPCSYPYHSLVLSIYLSIFVANTV